jgi:hypothetical protein
MPGLYPATRAAIVKLLNWPGTAQHSGPQALIPTFSRREKE